MSSTTSSVTGSGILSSSVIGGGISVAGASTICSPTYTSPSSPNLCIYIIPKPNATIPKPSQVTASYKGSLIVVESMNIAIKEPKPPKPLLQAESVSSWKPCIATVHK